MTKISASIQEPIESASICQTESISMRTTSTSHDRSKTTIAATTSSSHRFSLSQSIHQPPNYQNAILLLLPLLIMILKETSALPPIIKIGEFVAFIFSPLSMCRVRFIFVWQLLIVRCWTKYNGKFDGIFVLNRWEEIKPFDNYRPTAINLQNFAYFAYFSTYLIARHITAFGHDHSKHKFTCLFPLWE